MKLLTLAYEDGITIGEALNVSVTGMIVVLLILALLSVLVLLLSKAVRSVEKEAKTVKHKSDEKPASALKTAPATAPLAVPAPAAVPTVAAPASVDLFDVDEKTAAVIMAIVSNESGIPLNRLQFKSIKAIRK